MLPSGSERRSGGLGPPRQGVPAAPTATNVPTVNSDLEATAPASADAEDREFLDRQRRRIAELEELVAELPELRRRLLEAEQLLAELPELRRRSERLAEIEASPTMRTIARVRERYRLRASAGLRSVRHRLKLALGHLARRIAGDE